MNIKPFIQDMTEEEYVNEFKAVGFGALTNEDGVRAKHQYHSKSFEDVVKEYKAEALRDITDPGDAMVAAQAVDTFISGLMYEFTAPICNARWVVSEYSGRMENGELVEETRPVKISPREFWKNVNN